VIASKDIDYERLGLAPGAVAPWEDGARTDNRRGTYEWWYFDSHLDDGASLVVTFMNKDIVSPNDPLTPTIRLDLDLADGRSFQKLATYAPDREASTADADVRIAENRFAGDLHSYRIQASVGQIAIDVTLVGHVPAETADWTTCSRSAARVKLPSSAIATKVASCRSSTPRFYRQRR
jgi:hypothetical protein